MPVEIKEVVIRAVITQDNEWSSREKNGSVSGEAEKGEMIQACVQEVLRILKRTKDR